VFKNAVKLKLRIANGALAILLLTAGCAKDRYPQVAIDREQIRVSRTDLAAQNLQPEAAQVVANEPEVISVAASMSAEASEPAVQIAADVSVAPLETAATSLIEQSEFVTLDELVSLGLANNPAIAELSAAANKAAGYRTQVGLYANPIIGYQGQQLADRGTDQHLLFAEQEYVTANKLQLNRSVQNEAVRAQLQEWEAQKLRVTTDIQVLFYEAVGFQKQLALIEAFRGVMDRGTELAKLRFNAAESSKIDLLQSQVQRSEIDVVHRRVLAQYSAAWRELSAIIGLPLPTNCRFVGEFPESHGAMRWEETAASIVARSPEYSAAQARISQARAELHRQGVQAVPNLTWQLGAGKDNGTGSGMINLQVGGPVPLFNNNQGNIAAARAEYCRATMEAQRIEQAIRARLANVSRDFESSLGAVEVYRNEMLPNAGEALQLAESAYKAGEMDFVQLLVARRNYFESNLLFVDAQSRLAVARTKIDGLLLSGALDPVTDQSGSDALRDRTFGQQ
jgi:cobalt-zinc-cadmium efflux system outer membrane protein